MEKQKDNPKFSFLHAGKAVFEGFDIYVHVSDAPNWSVYPGTPSNDYYKWKLWLIRYGDAYYSQPPPAQPQNGGYHNVPPPSQVQPPPPSYGHSAPTPPPPSFQQAAPPPPADAEELGRFNQLLDPIAQEIKV
jgi:hypothetical protein